MMKFLKISIFLSIVGFLTACDSSTVFKDNKDIIDAKWTIKNTPSFSFDIADQQAYNVFFLVRNGLSYKYNNLYFQYSLYDASNKLVAQELINASLFDPTTGKPTGDGSGSIFEHRLNIKSLTNYRFPSKGKYTIKFTQYMREDPLSEILSIGVAVEKAL
jgi:gliding motility-associated lipoprotein GldH